ncbi:MAG TPA: SDR family oxidoreductase [Amycolatopsis sp.]|uniref:SDR family NAD(P)-dependent oxidoreductase n=1 Tax=Amycolatopsis sp. TaxID=37632 RepID=UPI002B49BE21|nr:SDR family oxidoreductase [Amycolatopsis sp.]HKS47486.1 SDR family oxidoreductase [Amycolatopsis sp.]
MQALLPERVIVTGGASGIGEAVIRAFAAGGAEVGIINRSEDSVERALKNGLADVADRVHWRIADVADEAAVVTAVDELSTELGGVQAVVASAGIVGEFGASLGEVTSSDFRRVLEVNVLGVFHLVKAALPHLAQQPNPSVTIVGSDSGFVAVPGMLAYNASKGALVQLTRAMSVELYEEHGVRVNSICPSIVDTPMSRGAMDDEGFEGADFPVHSPDDVAWSVLYLSAANSRAINGVNLLSDFGYTARSSFPA